MNKLDKKYVSPADQFLHEFDNSHKLSASQQAEVAKHQAVFTKRDTPTTSHADDDSSLWD